nr:unnamed protein product [Callosobruchus chinensis]
MFDLSRAFDTIDHKLLLEKLQRLGVRGVTNKWVSSYLEKRTQIVMLDNCKSEPKEVMAGVPQGSILGPLFFIIFMNDMVLSCDTPDKTVIYADDTNFFVSSKVLQDAIGKANHSTEQFQTWCTNNGLTLNSNKTKYISFLPKNLKPDYSPLVKIGKTSIEKVDSSKFLGVVIDHKMTWEEHVKYVNARLSTISFITRHLRGTVSFDVLRKLYYGLVQSALSYGLIFWGNSAHAHNVFSTQKRIMRCIAGVHPRSHCKQLFIQYKILTLPCLYIYLLIMNIKKHEEHYIRNNMVHGYGTRSAHNIRQYYSRLSVCQNSHIYMGITCYNKILKSEINSSNFDSFKINLFNYLAEHAFYSVNEFLNDSF